MTAPEHSQPPPTQPRSAESVTTRRARDRAPRSQRRTARCLAIGAERALWPIDHDGVTTSTMAAANLGARRCQVTASKDLRRSPAKARLADEPVALRANDSALRPRVRAQRLATHRFTPSIERSSLPTAHDAFTMATMAPVSGGVE